MKKLLLIIMLLISSAFIGCAPSTSGTNLCEYDGHEIIDYVTRESDCNCGRTYNLHLKNGNNFEEVRVNAAVFRHYLKTKPKEGYYKITCKEGAELKED
jgi:hypothetical protein